MTKMKKGNSESYGTVYFIGLQDAGPVKIGFTASQDVHSRLKQLQIGNSGELVVLGKIDAGPGIERTIHSFLSPHIVRGEWFEREAALTLLARLKSRRLAHGENDFYERLLFCMEQLVPDEEDSFLETRVARDLIRDMAWTLSNVDTENPLPFLAWLLLQRERDDPIGDLANDALRDPDFPKLGNLVNYLVYVTSKTTEPAVTRTVLEAWIECDIATFRLQDT